MLAVLLTPASIAQQGSKPSTLDRNAFTFLNWDLNLRIERQTESLFARGKVLVRNDSTQPQDQASLQISSSLKWASIRQNGTTSQFASAQVRSDLDHTGNVQEAVIKLASAVAPGATME